MRRSPDQRPVDSTPRADVPARGVTRVGGRRRPHDVVGSDLEAGPAYLRVGVDEAVLVVGDPDEVVGGVRHRLELDQLLVRLPLRVQQQRVVQREGAPVGDVRHQVEVVVGEGPARGRPGHVDHAEQQPAGTQGHPEACLLSARPEHLRDDEGLQVGEVRLQGLALVRNRHEVALTAPPGPGLERLAPGPAEPDDRGVGHRLGDRPDGEAQQRLGVQDLAGQRGGEVGQQGGALPRRAGLSLDPPLVRDVGGHPDRADDHVMGVAHRLVVDREDSAAELALHREGLPGQDPAQRRDRRLVVPVDGEEVPPDELAGLHLQQVQPDAGRQGAAAGHVEAEDDLGPDRGPSLRCLVHRSNPRISPHACP